MRKILACATCIFFLSCLEDSDNSVKTDASVKEDVITDASVTDANVITDSESFDIRDAGNEEEIVHEAGMFDGNFNIWDRYGMKPFFYRGGPVITNPSNLHIIWYGDWNNKQQTVAILEDLFSNIGGSQYLNTNADYYQSASNLSLKPMSSKSIFVNTNVTFTESYYDNYSLGKYLYQSDIPNIISKIANKNFYPENSTDLYFVLIDSDVQLDLGYYLSCSSFCGYHENFVLHNKDVQYALIVNPEKCLHNCSAKEQYIINGFNHSPNNDWVADAMASIIAHELNEILTDPLPTKNPAWQNPAKWENADMSAWTYGQLYVTTNNSVANVKIGERDYLIQQNWIYDEDGGHPGLSK